MLAPTGACWAQHAHVETRTLQHLLNSLNSRLFPLDRRLLHTGYHIYSSQCNGSLFENLMVCYLFWYVEKFLELDKEKGIINLFIIFHRWALFVSFHTPLISYFLAWHQFLSQPGPFLSYVGFFRYHVEVYVVSSWVYVEHCMDLGQYWWSIFHFSPL